MTEQEDLITRFQKVIDDAVKYVSRRNGLVDDADLYQYACLRILMFGNGDGWRSGKLRSDYHKIDDRFVWRTLVNDLFDYLDQEDRDRGEPLPISYKSNYDSPDIGTVTLEEYKSGLRPAEALGSIDDIELSEPQYLEDVTLPQIDLSDQDLLDFLDEKFPFLMSRANGRTETEIAEDFGSSYQKVNYRISKERGEFIRWIREDSTNEFVIRLKDNL